MQCGNKPISYNLLSDILSTFDRWFLALWTGGKTKKDGHVETVLMTQRLVQASIEQLSYTLHKT